MTSLNNPIDITRRPFAATAALLSCLALGLGVAGCGSEPEEEPVVQETRTAPPPPPEPQVPSIEELMADMGIHESVSLAESQAPESEEARRAVLTFFDGFARGDSRTVGEMLTALDQRELEALEESGQWRDTTEGITLITIQTGSVSMSEEEDDDTGLDLSVPGLAFGNEQVALAMFEISGQEPQVQVWYFNASGEDFQFEAAPTPPELASNLFGTDWIQSWRDLIAEEIALANRPDEEVRVVQRRMDDEEQSDPQSPRGGPGTHRMPQGPRQTPVEPDGPQRLND